MPFKVWIASSQTVLAWNQKIAAVQVSVYKKSSRGFEEVMDLRTLLEMLLFVMLMTQWQFVCCAFGRIQLNQHWFTRHECTEFLGDIYWSSYVHYSFFLVQFSGFCSLFFFVTLRHQQIHLLTLSDSILLSTVMFYVLLQHWIRTAQRLLNISLHLWNFQQRETLYKQIIICWITHAESFINQHLF